MTRMLTIEDVDAKRFGQPAMAPVTEIREPNGEISVATCSLCEGEIAFTKREALVMLAEARQGKGSDGIPPGWFANFSCPH